MKAKSKITTKLPDTAAAEAVLRSNLFNMEAPILHALDLVRALYLMADSPLVITDKEDTGAFLSVISDAETSVSKAAQMWREAHEAWRALNGYTS